MAGFLGSWQSPSTSFGNLMFTKPSATPVNPWQSYLANLNNEQQASALGLGAVEGPDQQDEAWNRWLAVNAGSMSPSTQLGLRQNRGQLFSAYNQARASQPDVRFAQFLSQVDPTLTTQAWSPQTALRPVTFRRIRVNSGY